MNPIKLLIKLYIWVLGFGITANMLEMTGLLGKEAAALHKQGLFSLEKFNRKLISGK